MRLSKLLLNTMFNITIVFTVTCLANKIKKTEAAFNTNTKSLKLLIHTLPNFCLPCPFQTSLMYRYIYIPLSSAPDLAQLAVHPNVWRVVGVDDVIRGLMYTTCLGLSLTLCRPHSRGIPQPSRVMFVLRKIRQPSP